MASIANIKGKPFTVPHFKRWAKFVILDNGKPWAVEKFQADFLEDVFAGYNECWLIVPEGNAKTTLIGGLTLYVCDYSEFADIPVAASSRDQAAIMYRQAEGMVARSEDLNEDGRIKCQEGYKRIKNLNTGGRIQIFASDDRTGDGVIPTVGVCDELHRHKDLSLYRTWRGKLKKRRGQLLAISTAGEPGSEFEITRTKIREEAIESRSRGCFVRAASKSIVMHEWAVPPGADVTDFKVVKAANPLKAIKVQDLKETFESPTMTMAHFKRFSCNIATRSGAAAITEAEWAAMLNEDGIPAKEPIWVGYDAGWKWDTTAIVPFWMPEPEHRQLGMAKILTPPRDGSNLEVAVVKKAFNDIHERNPIELVVMDMTRAEDIADWLRNELGIDVVDRTQSNRFAVMDYNAWMGAMRNGWLFHSGDEGLKKHALNAIARSLPGGETRFDRPKKAVNTSQQDRRVIDGLIAASFVHAVADAMVNQEEDDSQYFSWRPA